MSALRVGLVTPPPNAALPSFSAGMRGLDVVIFPELVLGGYAALMQGAAPCHAGDEAVTLFRRISGSLHATCIGGSIFLEDPSGRRTNTSLVFRHGRLVHRYDKIHLFRPTGDTRWFSPGRSIGTFVLPSVSSRVRAGVILCYDLRFPELARAMALQGMRVLFVPARWPKERDDAWQTLLKARAIENQIFVVGCNARGPEGGHSYVFDPGGNMLFSSRRAVRAPLHTVTLDLALLEEARDLHRNIDEAVLLKKNRIPRTL